MLVEKVYDLKIKVEKKFNIKIQSDHNIKYYNLYSIRIAYSLGAKN